LCLPTRSARATKKQLRPEKETVTASGMPSESWTLSSTHLSSRTAWKRIILQMFSWKIRVLNATSNAISVEAIVDHELDEHAVQRASSGCVLFVNGRKT
jgi:hypothetical protein